jgi:hypothetical protein
MFHAFNCWLQYPGNVNALMAQALLCVSQKPNFTYPILNDLEDCIEMLDDFGFQISGDVLVVMVVILSILLSSYSPHFATLAIKTLFSRFFSQHDVQPLRCSLGSYEPTSSSFTAIKWGSVCCEDCSQGLHVATSSHSLQPCTEECSSFGSGAT